MLQSQYYTRRTETKGNSHLDLANMVVRTPQTGEQLYFEESICPQTGEKCLNFKNDIYLMFHQERLDRMTADALFSKIQAAPKNDPLASLKNRLSPDELCRFVKSRYIQSMSELRNWSSYISEMYESEFQEFKASFASSEPAASPEPAAAPSSE